MKAVLIIAVAAALSSCAAVEKSAYSSGWNNTVSGETFTRCGRAVIGKGFRNPEVLSYLVETNTLTRDQADRATTADIRVGDPECQVYAAHGHYSGPSTFTQNKDSKLLQRDIVYKCESASVECPGMVYSIVDGRVTAITPYTEEK